MTGKKIKLQKNGRTRSPGGSSGLVGCGAHLLDEQQRVYNSVPIHAGFDIYPVERRARCIYYYVLNTFRYSVIAKSSDKSAATRTLVDEENFCSRRLFYLFFFFWPHDRANFVFTTDISRYFLHVVYDIHANILLDEHVENSAKNYNTHIVRTKRTVNRAAGWHEEVGIHHRVREYKY